MSLANSNGPRWIRAQHVAAEKRREGLGPVREFLAKLLRPGAAKRRDRAPAAAEAPRSDHV